MTNPTRFLARVQKLIDGFGRSDEPLDPISRDILLFIALETDEGRRLRQSDIRFNARFGSPATALGRLQNLIAEGWVTSSADPEDGRAQILRLSRKSQREITRLTATIKSLID